MPRLIDLFERAEYSLRSRRQQPGSLHGLFHELLGRKHLGDQSQFLSLLSIDHFAGHAKFLGFGASDHARQPLRAAKTGNQAEVDLRLTEPCLYRRRK